MGTIREIIERVNENNPNAYGVNTLVGWISQLDGKIGLNVMLMNAAEMQQFRYHYPEAMDYEPLVAFPHDDLYDLWLNVKIHGENGETERYQNALVLYNAAYRDYVRWFASTYAPAQDESSAVTYYITAYGLAVQQGYEGSLDDWLASLKGEKGDTGKSAYEYAVEAGFEGNEDLYREQVLNAGQSAYEYAVAGGYTGTPEEFSKKLASDYALSDHDHDTRYYTQTKADEKLKTVRDTAERAKETADDALPKAGGTMTGNINMSGMKVTGLGTPADDEDAATKVYVDAKHLKANAILAVDGWEGDAAPYTQTIVIRDAEKPEKGILETDRPHVSPVYATDKDTRAAQREAWALVSDGKTGDGIIVFTCDDDKPTTAIPIQIEVNR